MKKVVLFRRDFQRFTGGHLKVWDYFNHVRTSEDYEARIAFTPGSKWDDTNPWTNTKDYIADWNPDAADVLFLAGKDWSAINAGTLARLNKPIINLIQHPRHADPNDDLYQFLSHRAIRICVSQQTAEAINATNKVNGPVFTIPNGIAIEDIPAQSPNQERPVEVLICGLKAPELAQQIAKRLRQDENVAVTPLLDWIPRTEYLDQLGKAHIAVTLPRPTEGFYLPALEAMACGAVVVCPDCVGNRDFCHDGLNCFRPGYDVETTMAAIYRALGLSFDEANRIRKEAGATVRQHSLERERTSFLEILRRVDNLWNN